MAHRYFGAAVGKGRQQARTEIERLKLSEMSCREGVKELAKIIFRVHEEEKPFELEMAWVCEESGFEFQKVPADIQAEAERVAKAAMEDSDMED
jgi:20S proteasome subunit alpha 7